MLEENNIECVCVPAMISFNHCLDLSVNKPAKEFLWGGFQEWYASQIVDQLEEDMQQVDMRLSIVKPLGYHWLVALYDYICANPPSL